MFHDSFYAPVKKKEVIYGVNSTFSSENVSEPVVKTARFGLSSSLTSHLDSSTRSLLRADSSDSGGISIYQEKSPRSVVSDKVSSILSPSSLILDQVESRLEPESASEQSDGYMEREDSIVGKRTYGRPSSNLNQIVGDFVALERTTGRDLKLIAETLHSRLQSLMGKCRVLSDMFNIIKELRDSHLNWMLEMEEINKSADLSTMYSFPQKVLCAAHNAIPMYTNLINQYPIYISALDELSRSNTGFAAELLRIEFSDECYIPVNWLLLRIAQRIINWQPVLCRVVEYLLEEGLLDTEMTSSLTSSRVACEKVARFAESTQRQRESLCEYVAMLQIEKDVGTQGLLPHPNRRLLRIGRIERWSEKGLMPRILMLTSDRMLFAHRSQGDHPFSIHAEVKLKGMLVEDGDTYNVAGRRDDVITLHSGNKSIVLASRDKEAWLEDISSAVKQAAKCRLELPPLNLERKEERELEQLKTRGLESDSKPRLSPLQVCFHRHATMGIDDVQKLVSISQSGYLLRKLRNSSGWQRLWVVLSYQTLFFFKSHEDAAPLANLPLADYGLALPSLEDRIQHDNCFKLFFANHRYFFRADSQYTFNRWMESLRSSVISKTQMDLVTSLSMRI